MARMWGVVPRYCLFVCLRYELRSAGVFPHSDWRHLLHIYIDSVCLLICAWIGCSNTDSIHIFKLTDNDNGPIQRRLAKQQLFCLLFSLAYNNFNSCLLPDFFPDNLMYNIEKKQPRTDTPGSRGGSGFSDQTLAWKLEKSPKNMFFF